VTEKSGSAWYMKRYRDKVEQLKKKEEDYWNSMHGPVIITKIRLKNE
jgi:hypothetical protein